MTHLSVKNVEAKIESGYDFGELAKKYSLRKWTAKNKGELGLSRFLNLAN